MTAIPSTFRDRVTLLRDFCDWLGEHYPPLALYNKGRAEVMAREFLIAHPEYFESTAVDDSPVEEDWLTYEDARGLVRHLESLYNVRCYVDRTKGGTHYILIIRQGSILADIWTKRQHQDFCGFVDSMMPHLRRKD